MEEKKSAKSEKQPVSFEVVMQYAKYWLQHLDYLLLQQSDPLKRADFFSVIFDKIPSYADIKDVTGNVGEITGINELFRIKKMPVSSMVQQVGKKFTPCT